LGFALFPFCFFLPSFSQATVITVAHRLNTVVDCDRVMVLDAGALIEFDAPRSLVSREGSRFSQLLADTGARSARHLTAVALSVPLRVDEAGEEKGEGAAEEEAMEADWSLQTVVV
jgi:ABC-type multidrug transport system ATPase subunit